MHNAINFYLVPRQYKKTITKRSYLLYPPMHSQLVPLVIIEPRLSRFNVHLLFAIPEPHSKRHSTIPHSQIEVISLMT